MKVKTYGVSELTEWQGKLKAGSIEVEVLFTGGTASPSGAQPAYYVTKDPITQFVIENSKEFKDGFIFLMGQSDIPGEHPRMAVPKEAPAPVIDGANNVNNEPVSEDGNTVNNGNNESNEADAPIKITVGSKTEAIEWLKDHYPDKGYNGFTLKGKAAFEAACAENNVVFDIQG